MMMKACIAEQARSISFFVFWSLKRWLQQQHAFDVGFQALVQVQDPIPKVAKRGSAASPRSRNDQNQSAQGKGTDLGLICFGLPCLDAGKRTI